MSSTTVHHLPLPACHMASLPCRMSRRSPPDLRHIPRSSDTVALLHTWEKDSLSQTPSSVLARSPRKNGPDYHSISTTLYTLASSRSRDGSLVVELWVHYVNSAWLMRMTPFLMANPHALPPICPEPSWQHRGPCPFLPPRLFSGRGPCLAALSQ